MKNESLSIKLVEELAQRLNTEILIKNENSVQSFYELNFLTKILERDKIIPKKTKQYKLKKNQKYRILIIENQINTQYLLMKVLISQKCFLVDVVDSSEEGIKRFEKKLFDLIICDIKLTGLSGIEFSKYLRKTYDHKISNIPILAISGASDFSAQGKALSAGMDSFLAKPFTEEELLRKITRLLAIK